MFLRAEQWQWIQFWPSGRSEPAKERVGGSCIVEQPKPEIPMVSTFETSVSGTASGSIRMYSSRSRPVSSRQRVATLWMTPSFRNPSLLNALSLIHTSAGHPHASGSRDRRSLPSTPPRRLDSSHVDLPHRHHRFKGAFCLSAASRKRIGQRAGSDLP
jgi:hypothetical protein